MGCDIHLYVERRVAGVWQTADTWERDADDGTFQVPYEKCFYQGRNYDLFAILANVRNGHGFAGIKTGRGFNPIAEPRGIPDDACSAYKEVAAQWDGDGHSHSYFTIEELMGYDWTQKTEHQGYVDLQNYFRWKEDGKPQSWSGMVSGGAVTHHTPTDVDVAMETLGFQRWEAHLNEKDEHAKITKLLGAERPYVLVTWTEPYSDSVGNFLNETLPKLWRLGPPADVRICFFFDN